MAKSFKTTTAPELQFMSTETIKAAEREAEGITTLKATDAPDGYKVNPLYVETKSKRVQLVFQPTLHAKVKAAAEAAGLSFNEYCHRVLEDAVRED